MSNPKLLITVTTIVSLLSFPISFKYLPHIAMIKSPFIRLPFSSTARHLSASPSNANPKSHLLSTTYCINLSGCVEPHSLFMFIPSGSLFITKTSAPNFLNAFTEVI